MPQGFTTVSSTTYRVPQSTTRVWSTYLTGFLTFRVDGGSWFDIDAVRVLSYRQTLDLRCAVLTREVRFCDDAGRTSSLTQQRFVAMHMPHVGALQTTIVAEDWSGTIEIRSTLDGNVTNSLVERYRNLANDHLGLVEKREINDNSVLLTVQTTQSRVPIALAARNNLWRDGTLVPATYRLVDEAAKSVTISQSSYQSVRR